MAKKLSKKQLKKIQSLATNLVITSGVAKRVPARVVYKKKRSQAVKEAYNALYNKPKAAKRKSNAKQLKLKF